MPTATSNTFLPVGTVLLLELVSFSVRPVNVAHSAVVDKGKLPTSLVVDEGTGRSSRKITALYRFEAGDHIYTCYSICCRCIKCASKPFSRCKERLELRNELS